MSVLVITAEDDAHVDYLQKHFDEPFIIFDPSKFPKNNDITYKLNNGYFQIFSQNIELSSVQAIWYRKPRILTIDEWPVDKEYRSFAHSSYVNSIKMLYGLMRDKVWVSNPWSIWRSNNKAYQLELAYELGFRIPKTLITSSPEQAKKFILELDSVITKELSDDFIWKNGDAYGFYTTLINKNIDLSGLIVSPAIFQECINKLYDVRLTVIGSKIYPCAIYQTGDMQNEIDWRVGAENTNLIYKPITDFPSELGRKCVEMLNIMDLNFGAFDFVVDKDKNFWFMEVNPNGQWAFIEYETGMPISEGIANFMKKIN